MEERNILVLKKPLKVDGEELKELPYDFESMTAGNMLRATRDMVAAGFPRASLQEFDADFHLFLFAKAVEIATKEKVSVPDVMRLSAADAIKGGTLARNFFFL